MKFIFDFDNVLFHTTPGFREHVYTSLERVGISYDSSKEYLEKERLNLFSLKKMLIHFSATEDLYEEIMSENTNFVNDELLKVIRKIGKSNCYIVTYGEEEFQLDKIKKAGIDSFFCEIIAVPGSKKEAVEKICIKHNDEKVIFIDDTAKHFEDLDFKKHPNLQTIHYDEQGFDKFISILPPQ
jgi:FMN phosphatase YigB (HAD superfamily)